MCLDKRIAVFIVYSCYFRHEAGWDWLPFVIFMETLKVSDFICRLLGSIERIGFLLPQPHVGVKPLSCCPQTKPLKISTNTLLRVNGCQKPSTLRDSHVAPTQMVITLWRKVSFQNGRPGRGTSHLWLERELNTRSWGSLITAFVSRVVWPPEITEISPEIKTCLRKCHCGLPSLLPWSHAPFPLVDGQSYT